MGDSAAAQALLSRLPPEQTVQVLSNVLQERPELAPAVVAVCVPDLTYSPARAFAERRARGTVKSFRANGAFGFIDCPDLKGVFGQDVWVHEKQLNGVPVGTEVTFAVALSRENKPQAYDILLPDAHGGHDRPVSQVFGQGAYPPVDFGKGFGKQGFDKGFGKPVNVPPPPVCNDWGMGKGYPPPQDSYPPPQGAKRSHPGSDGPEIPAERILGTYTGTVKNYTDKGSYGYAFISCPLLNSQGYTNDVYLHQHHMNGAQVGQEVQFTAYLSNKNLPQAKDVEVLGGVPPPPALEAGYGVGYDAG